MPARPAIILNRAGPKDLVPDTMPNDFPSDELVEPKAISFTSANGMTIPAQLFMPAGASAGDGLPGVIYLHGGPRRQVLLGWHYMSYYHHCYTLNQYLASKGYVVLSINYRSGIGYGMEFREAFNYSANGASEYQDVFSAGLYLRDLPETDPNRIGLWGGSHGGYLTAMGLAKASDLFSAGVDIHGVHDWNEEIRYRSPLYDPLEHPEFAEQAFRSSPMAYIDTWRSPVLLITGDDDRNVPSTLTSTLVEALRERNVEFEQLVFPDEVHMFLRHSSWLRTLEASADFLDRKL